jgi:hypothetical protein
VKEVAEVEKINIEDNKKHNIEFCEALFQPRAGIVRWCRARPWAG